MDALEFGAETTAKNDPERDAKRLARVRLAEDKHQRSGTVSSPQTGPSNGLSSAGMSTLGLGSAAITSKEDIVRRMDSLAQELERLRAALSVVGDSNNAHQRVTRSNLSSRSLSHEYHGRRLRSESRGELPPVNKNFSSKTGSFDLN